MIDLNSISAADLRPGLTFDLDGLRFCVDWIDGDMVGASMTSSGVGGTLECAADTFVRALRAAVEDCARHVFVDEEVAQ